MSLAREALRKIEEKCEELKRKTMGNDYSRLPLKRAINESDRSEPQSKVRSIEATPSSSTSHRNNETTSSSSIWFDEKPTRSGVKIFKFPNLLCPIETGQLLFETEKQYLPDLERQLTTKINGIQTFPVTEKNLDAIYAKADHVSASTGWKLSMAVLKFLMFYSRQKESFVLAKRPEIDVKLVAATYDPSLLPQTKRYIERVDKKNYFYDCVEMFNCVSAFSLNLREVVQKLATHFVHSYLLLPMMETFPCADKPVTLSFPRQNIDIAIEVVTQAITTDTAFEKSFLAMTIDEIFKQQVDSVVKTLHTLGYKAKNLKIFDSLSVEPLTTYKRVEKIEYVMEVVEETLPSSQEIHRFPLATKGATPQAELVDERPSSNLSTDNTTNMNSDLLMKTEVKPEIDF